MIVQQTLTQLRALKLDGMASAFEEQLTLPTSGSLAFEDRFALLVERERWYRLAGVEVAVGTAAPETAAESIVLAARQYGGW